MSSFEPIETEGAPIKAWTAGMPVDPQARRLLENVARLPLHRRHPGRLLGLAPPGGRAAPIPEFRFASSVRRGS